MKLGMLIENFCSLTFYDPVSSLDARAPRNFGENTPTILLACRL